MKRADALALFCAAIAPSAGRYSQEQLAWAFELVMANIENWRGPISCTIPASRRAAVEHFTGSEATFEPEGSSAYLRVRAAGYCAACGV